MKFRTVHGILFILISVSCTREIEIDVSGRSPRLVLNCMLSANEKAVAYVSQTTGLTDVHPPFIGDAMVELFENGVRVAELEYADSGVYISDYVIREKRYYEIRVSKAGFETISGGDSVPEAVVLRSARCDYGKYYHIDGSDMEPLYSFESTISDEMESENYYCELFIHKFAGYSGYQSLIVIRSGNEIISAEGMLGYFPNYCVFSDNLFSGTVAEIRADCGGMTWSEAFPEYTAHLQEGYYIMLLSTSKTFYKFMKSLVVHKYNMQMSYDTDEVIYKGYTGDPSPLYSNIKNGYGIVTAFSVSLLPAQFTDFTQK